MKIEEDDLRKFEYMVNGVLIHGEKVVYYANDAAAAILGFRSREEIMNFDLYKLVPVEYKNVVFSRIERALKGELLPPILERVFTRDGRSVILKFNIFPIEFRGKLAALSIFTPYLQENAKREVLEGLFKVGELIANKALGEDVPLSEMAKEIHDRLKNVIPDMNMTLVNLKDGKYTIEYCGFSDFSLKKLEVQRIKPIFDAFEEAREMYEPGYPAVEMGLESENGDSASSVSVFSVPISVEGKVAMVIVFMKKGYGSFDPEDIEVFRRVKKLFSLYLKLDQCFTDY